MQFVQGAIAGIAVLVLAMVPVHAQPANCASQVEQACGKVFSHATACCVETDGTQKTLKCTATGWEEAETCPPIVGTGPGSGTCYMDGPPDPIAAFCQQPPQ
jgi:hypothetical protein